MKEQCLHLHAELLQVLQVRQAAGRIDLANVEDCFRISMQYWNHIKELVKEYTFSSAADEVEFFKHIKPLFTSQIEYYMQVYQATLFLPFHEREDQLLFWDRELGKLKRFSETHAAFIAYYLSGRTDQDSAYFVRLPKEGGSIPGAPFYDLDCRASSLQDGLVAKILAFRHYREFVQTELAKLQKQRL